MSWQHRLRWQYMQKRAQPADRGNSASSSTLWLAAHQVAFAGASPLRVAASHSCQQEVFW